MSALFAVSSFLVVDWRRPGSWAGFLFCIIFDGANRPCDDDGNDKRDRQDAQSDKLDGPVIIHQGPPLSINSGPSCED